MRLVLAGLAMLWLWAAAVSAHAAEPERFPLVGFLATGRVGPDDPTMAWFREGLREFGHVDGESIRLEFRSAQGRTELLPGLARELVSAKASAIVVGTETAARAARSVTDTVPIVAVLFDYDPVAGGLVESLSKPGSNVTGVFTRQPELLAKRLELVKEVFPQLSNIPVIFDAEGVRQMPAAESAAKVLGTQLLALRVQGPLTYGTALRSAKQRGARAAVLLYSWNFYIEQPRLVEESLRNRVGLVSWMHPLTRQGGLLSYGPDGRTTFGRAAYYVDRILKGSKPSELPMEQPTDLVLVLNLKTAKALGIEIPESVLGRADEVIR